MDTATARDIRCTGRGPLIEIEVGGAVDRPTPFTLRDRDHSDATPGGDPADPNRAFGIPARLAGSTHLRGGGFLIASGPLPSGAGEGDILAAQDRQLLFLQFLQIQQRIVGPLDRPN